MNLMIVLGGMALLIALAIVIGTDRHARHAAWRHIAKVRREQHEREIGLRHCLTGARCPDCPVNRYFGDW